MSFAHRVLITDITVVFPYTNNVGHTYCATWEKTEAEKWNKTEEGESQRKGALMHLLVLQNQYFSHLTISIDFYVEIHICFKLTFAIGSKIFLF